MSQPFRVVRVAVVALTLLASLAQAQVKTWTTDGDFDAGDLVQVAHPPRDQLQLGPTPVTRTTIVWATNYYPSWVLKLDTSTGKQLGRYDSALQFINGVATGARPPREYCNWADQGNCPGRVTVDNNGDVWIVNRAFGQQGSLSKFSGFPEHCIDRNHNGRIDTARDSNNDGVIDVNNGGEFYGQNDECILTTIPVSGVNAIPRGVAVDRNGKIWVATCNENKVYRYNPNEPVALEAIVNVPSSCPYSLATGGAFLFISGAGGPTSRVNIDTLGVDSAPCPGTYGIVGDPSGNTAWLGGYFTTEGIYKADFGNHQCLHYSTNTSVTAMTLDLDGNVWAADYSGSSLHKFSPQGGVLGVFNAGGSNPHGLSVDFAGNVWTILHGPPSMGKLKPDGTFLGSYNISGPTNDNYDPYIYSDFTGVQVNRQAPYTYFGTWSDTYDGGVPAIPWSTVTYNQEPQGQAPCDNATNRCTKVAVFVRAADDLNKLPTVGYTPVKNGAALAGVIGQYVQIEVDLTGPGYLTPVLSDVAVIGPCGQNGVNDACCLRDSDCDDKNPCTTDRCPMPGQACSHAARIGCCLVDKECGDNNLCTTDRCPMPGGVCQNAPVPGCCNGDKDCGDGNLCTTDTCSAPGGKCSHVAIGGCCNGNPDCDDGNSCTIDLCSGAGGSCSHFAKANCCNVDADCDDMNACTADTCSGQGGECTHTQNPACCNSDADCDDHIDCTDDKCSGPGGACSHPKKQNCCQGAGECSDDDACTSDDCIKGSCVHQAMLRCCNSDPQCADGDPCTTDTCTGPGGTCVHGRVASCCNLPTDCDDHDPCTNDSCSGMGGQCQHAATGAGCCKKDADCDDQIACTTDRCESGAACTHTPLANCFCAADSDCPAGQICVDHACGGPTVGDGGALLVGTYASGTGAFAGCSVGGARGRGAGLLPLLALLLAWLAFRRPRAA